MGKRRRRGRRGESYDHRDRDEFFAKFIGARAIERVAFGDRSRGPGIGQRAEEVLQGLNAHQRCFRAPPGLLAWRGFFVSPFLRLATLQFHTFSGSFRDWTVFRHEYRELIDASQRDVWCIAHLKAGTKRNAKLDPAISHNDN